MSNGNVKTSTMMALDVKGIFGELMDFDSSDSRNR